ncbi:MAG: NFACT family protein [Oscillospiraceae bacterium]|nr:NFACT family protein [Oscillospiraceae bacterium]
MPLDAITLHALCKELAPALAGAKIDKVQQPERDLLLLSLRTLQGNKKLLIAAGTSGARVHFTAETPENPAEPPMFCMLLRKHLVGARIRTITQPSFERMLVMELDTRNEMGDRDRKTLVAELIGRSANLILVDEDGRIIDCLRRMDFAGSEERRLQPGCFYRLPPSQKKASFFSLTGEEREQLLAQVADGQAPEDWLLDTFSGLSPLLCRELSYRSGGSFVTLDEQMGALADCLHTGDFTPTMLLENGQPKDFSFLPIRQYGEAVENLAYPSFSELLDAFYARRERAERQRRHSAELLRVVRTVRDRISRKLTSQREEYRRTEGREDVRKRAELLTANLYRVHKGDSELCCEDYYEPDAPEIRIPLDPLKTPQQNAAALFKEYNKLKAAQAHLERLIAEGERQLDYLCSALDQIERAEGEQQLGELRRELTETGFLKKQARKRTEKLKPAAPLRYVTDDGLEILVGRSNLQNDELTTKLGRRTDLWLHTQKVHGSHVLLRCEGLEPPARSIEQAASLAAYHSQGRASGKLAVDYTMLRNVKKPSGSLPGKVIYTDYRTILVEADEALAQRLKKK